MVTDDLHADRPLSTASVGKLLLLLEAAERLDGRVLERRDEDRVADSGLWQHLASDALPIEDLAVLVAAHSDNLAANVLLREVGLEAVRERGRALGLAVTELHDRVRDVRGPEHPPRLSTGSASELVGLAETIDGTVARWLATNTDLSMVPGALGFDPLAHTQGELWNKTGTDDGVRADVGVLRGKVAYAVIANWDPAEGDRHHEVLAAMRRLGTRLATAL